MSETKTIPARFWLIVPLAGVNDKQSAAAAGLPRVAALGESVAIAELKAMADEGLLLQPQGFLVSESEMKRDPEMRSLVKEWETKYPEKIRDYRTKQKNVPHTRGADPEVEK